MDNESKSVEAVMDECPMVLIAADIVRKTVEGDVSWVGAIQDRFAGHNLILLKSCLCQGLEEAEAPTVDGRWLPSLR